VILIQDLVELLFLFVLNNLDHVIPGGSGWEQILVKLLASFLLSQFFVAILSVPLNS
jgi:hypothetical protein